MGSRVRVPYAPPKQLQFKRLELFFCLYSSCPTVGQSAQNTYIPKAAHWPAGKRTLKHPQRRLHKRSAFFVRIFGVVLKRVFRGKKISGLLFKISGSDFEIRATNFFFAPMWDKCIENQFSNFPPGNSRFCGQVSTGLDAIKAVYLQRRRNYFMDSSPRPYSFRNERSLYAATYALSI